MAVKIAVNGRKWAREERRRGGGEAVVIVSQVYTIYNEM
jgi:hypothetical protein